MRDLSVEAVEREDDNMSFREIIRGEQGQPVGRLNYSITSGLKADGSRIIVLSTTARGAPEGADIESAMRFLERGRELIVTRFAQITTEEAHKVWGRRQ